MNDIEFLADQLQRTYRGQAWHGPALRETLANVTADQAQAKPSPAVHSICEITMHLGTWINAVRRRLAGEVVEPTPAEDWPPVGGGSEAAWQETLSALDCELQRLHDAIAALPETALKARVAGADYSVRFMLQGAIQHNLYHAGQIALLKKML